jgi:hypothetical protein
MPDRSASLPPELFAEWLQRAIEQHGRNASTVAGVMVHKTAEYIADLELELTLNALESVWNSKDSVTLEDMQQAIRAIRRPKLQTLNSIALQMLGTIERDAHYLPEITDTIRKALEASAL